MAIRPRIEVADPVRLQGRLPSSSRAVLRAENISTRSRPCGRSGASARTGAPPDRRRGWRHATRPRLRVRQAPPAEAAPLSASRTIGGGDAGPTSPPPEHRRRRGLSEGAHRLPRQRQLVVATWHCDIPNVTLPGESALVPSGQLLSPRRSARLDDRPPIAGGAPCREAPRHRARGSGPRERIPACSRKRPTSATEFRDGGRLSRRPTAVEQLRVPEPTAAAAARREQISYRESGISTGRPGQHPNHRRPPPPADRDGVGDPRCRCPRRAAVASSELGEVARPVHERVVGAPDGRRLRTRRAVALVGIRHAHLARARHSGTGRGPPLRRPSQPARSPAARWRLEGDLGVDRAAAPAASRSSRAGRRRRNAHLVAAACEAVSAACRRRWG
jgi:hypothetical protein